MIKLIKSLCDILFNINISSSPPAPPAQVKNITSPNVDIIDIDIPKIINSEKKSLELQKYLNEYDSNSKIEELPTSSIITFNKFLENDANKSKVFNFYLNKVKYAIRNNTDQIIFFRLKHSAYLCKLDKKDYSRFLVSLKNWFVLHEEYEQAAVCQTLMETLTTDN